MLAADVLPYEAGPADKIRQEVLAPLLPLIHRAEKFIFDSGSDKDERTVTAVRETAVNMIDAGLFHQPHKLIWVEDPFENAPDERRNFYLGIEEDDHIRLYFFQQHNQQVLAKELGLDLSNMRQMPNLCFHAFPAIIDLRTASDEFVIGGPKLAARVYAKPLSEAVYSYKKLIVTLATRNLEVERIRAPKDRSSSQRFRRYDHQIIRIPLDLSDPSGERASGSSSKRRKHLVRGFVWGKHTRPSEQQRWIKPYWRGDAEIGIIEHDHYEVR